MEAIVALLTDPNSVAHIALVYSAIVTIGLALGRVRVYGISLGVIVVMFVGLVFAHFGVKINPEVLNFTRDFGLILFIFFVGLQVGPSFFSSFKSVGVALNGLMFLTVLIGIAITIGLFFLFSDQVSLPQVLGVHYGAITCTPGLGATKEALEELHYHGEDIAIAYACAYPLGLVTIIGVAILLRALFKINLEEEDKHWEDEEKEINQAPVVFHVYVTNHLLDGLTLRECRRRIPRPFICSRLLHKGEITSPNADTVLHYGDTIRLVTTPDQKMDVVAAFGQEDNRIDLATEHSPIERQKVIITRSEMNGRTVGDLELINAEGVHITRVWRAGMELFPYDKMHLQVGDILQCVGPINAIKRLAGYVGNHAKVLEQPNLAAIFLGITLGVFFGSLPMAIPGMPTPLKLGLAGGPLIIAILLGRFGAFFRLPTYTSNSANLIIREVGIALFLASVGLSAGGNFVETIVKGNGMLYAFIGFFITFVPQFVVGVVSRKFCHMNYHSILGLLAGACTNSPILAYTATLSQKSAAAVAYSTVYPLAMFIRIITGQVILVCMWAWVSLG